MSAYTPGPWKAGQGGDSNPRVYSKRGQVICQFHDGMDEEYTGHRNAENNARLIAAAPDLLAALKTLLAYYSDTSGFAHSIKVSVAVDMARTAIAKATERP